MPDIELIATNAPVVRIKQVKEKKLKDKKKTFDKRPKVQNINPRDVDPLVMLKDGNSHGMFTAYH